MGDRQYGVLPGTRFNGTPPPPYPPAQAQRRSQSPLKQTFSPFQDSRHSPSPPGRAYARHDNDQQQHGDRAHLSRGQDTLGPTPPPPPAHRSAVAQSHHPSAPVYPATTPSVSTSEVSLYSPQDGQSRALHGLDQLYAPRLTPSSVERGSHAHSPYRDASPQSRPDTSQTRLSKTLPNSMMAVHPGTASFHRPVSLTRASFYQGDGYDDIDPEAIVDDPDDVFRDPTPRSRSRISFGRRISTPAAAGVPGTGTSGASQGHLSNARDASGNYQAVPTSSQLDLPETRHSEKSDWLTEHENRKRRRRKRLFIVLGIVVIVGIIVGAVVGGIFASRKSSGGSGNGSKTTNAGTSSASSSGTHSGGLYDIDSDEVQAVMGQQALHKVFPGMDYTPLNAQYPDCLSNPPDQNNITLDLAVMSQLTPAVRLYGTDCNQTEMVLAAIDRLKMNDTMQVWLGVWLENNATTNSRQLSQMYSILDKYPSSHFAGVIIGNEVLFREDMTLYQLSQTLTQVRNNLTAKQISLPLATSDLGDNWDAGLAATSDIVMANIHPFFAGVTPDVAPGWTWNFWQTKDSKLTTAKTGSWPKSIVSEVGWPSEGGSDCGTGTTTCPAGQGAVASVDNVNKFMDGYVCQSLNNGTTFFWFSAFDEPWKAIFNTASDQWESKWGLMDVDRNLKSGLNIPDCGGKTVTQAY